MADFEVTFTGHWTEQTFSASLSFRTPEDDHPRHVVWGMSLPELQALYRSIDDALQVERNARHQWEPSLPDGTPEGALVESCERCPAERLAYNDGSTVPQVGDTDWCPQAVPA